ncbi:MAG TPA: hypothetical protein VKB14_18250 [Actinomycetales bacterium]|nr:hypothetical protein [Actinomycetales bacterium]
MSAVTGDPLGSAASEPIGSAASEPVGSAAEEAARLVDSLHGWLAERVGTEHTGPGARGADQSGSEQAGNEHAAPEEPAAAPEHGPYCRGCPVCRGLAYVHETHPEVVEHLATAARHLASALRALAADLTDPAYPPSAAHDGDREGDHGAGSAEGPDRSHEAAAPDHLGRFDDPDRSHDADRHEAAARPRSRAVPIVVEPDPDLRNSGPSEQEPEP